MTPDPIPLLATLTFAPGAITITLTGDAIPELTSRYSGAFDVVSFDPTMFDTDDATFTIDPTPGVGTIVAD